MRKAIPVSKTGSPLIMLDSGCGAGAFMQEVIAVHTELIKARGGRRVKIRIRPGATSYNGTTRNGVSPIRYGMARKLSNKNSDILSVVVGFQFGRSRTSNYPCVSVAKYNYQVCQKKGQLYVAQIRS